MNRKLLAVLLAVLVALLTAGALSAAAEGAADGESAVIYRNVKISVNGEKVLLIDANDEQQKSIIAGGQVYVPVETFISALGGTTVYSEENNQLVIVLPERESGPAAAEETALSAEPEEADGPEEPSADQEAEETAAPAEITEQQPAGDEAAPASQPETAGEPSEGTKPDLSADEQVSEILMSGRWVWAEPAKGTFTFLEFGKKNRGSIMTMTDFTWSVENRLVHIKYKTDKEYTKSYTFEENEGSFCLVGEDERVYVLNGRQDPRAHLIGTWYADADQTTALEISVTGEFTLKVITRTYSGKWKLDGTLLILSTQGIEVKGTYEDTYGRISLNIGGRKFTFTR